MSFLTTSVFADCLPPLKKALASSNVVKKPATDGFQHNQQHRPIRHLNHTTPLDDAADNTRSDSDSRLPNIHPNSNTNSPTMARSSGGKHYVFSPSNFDLTNPHICVNKNTDVVQETRHPLHVSHQASDASALAWLCELINTTLRAILPRRCAEPTGPFALIADMVLSLFVSAGATRASINRLPLFVVRHLDECGANDRSHHEHCKDLESDTDNANYDNDTNSVALALPLSLTLPKPTPTSNPEKCPICLAPFEDGDQVRQLPECRHVFHTECVDAWLQKKSLCPVCKIDPC